MTAPRQREARAGLDLRLLRAAVFAGACVALSAAGHSLASAATVPPWTLAIGFLATFVVAVPLAGRPRSLGGITTVLTLGQIGLHALFGLGQQHMTMPHSSAETSLIRHVARLLGGTDATGTGTGAGTETGTGTGADAGLTSGTASGSGMRPVHGTGSMHSMESMHGTGSMHGMGPMHGMGSMHGMGPTGAADGAATPLVHALAMLPSLPMLLGHVLAALAAGWLLRRGDLAVFRLVSLSAQDVADAALVRALRAALALVRTLRSGLSGARPPGPRPPRTPASLPPPLRTGALQHTVIRRGPPPAALCTRAA